MDWIKVRVKHVDYDYRHLSPDVFKAWIELMILCAGLEKIPTKKQMIDRVGLGMYNAVSNALRKEKVTLNYVLEKVFEDVIIYQRDRERGKGRQKAYREAQRNAVTNAVSNGVTSAEVRQEIRGDKIRGDKTDNTGSLSRTLRNDYAKNNNINKYGPVDNSERPVNRGHLVSEDGRVQKLVEGVSEGFSAKG